MKERNYAAFWGIIKRIPHADKEEIIRHFTSGRTTSLREMTDSEYSAMIRRLRIEVQDESKIRSLRSSVLKLMQQYGVDTTNWQKVSDFTGQPRIAGKHFARLSIEELKILSRKLRSMLSKKNAGKLDNLPPPEMAIPPKSKTTTYIITSNIKAKA